MKVSLIVTTYNWPEALEASLRTAFRQSHGDYEIIVADDGSSESTRDVVSSLKKESPCKLAHVWQKDKGFRAASIRNKAIVESEGDYVIFIDGDCLLPPSFIAEHLLLAKKGWFVAGSRIKLSPAMTNQVLSEPGTVMPMTRISLLGLWIGKKVKRAHPIVKLPLGNLRCLRSMRWQGAVTCNMGVWRKDLVAVNGFDNEFVGWGLEDSELVARLLNFGVRRKDGKMFSFVAHLHHEERSRDARSVNQARFESSLFGGVVSAESGLKEVGSIE